MRRLERCGPVLSSAAMGTALDRSESQTDLALKASTYGVPAWPVDGMDVLAVRDAAQGTQGKSANSRRVK